VVSEPEQTDIGLADPRRLQALRRPLEERAVLTYCTDGATFRYQRPGLARMTHRDINAQARDAGITAAMLAMAACAPVGAVSALRLPHTIAGQAARAIERLWEAL
jgi:hypothetical protein